MCFWAFVGRIGNLRNKRNMKIGKLKSAKGLLKNIIFPTGRSLICIYVTTMEFSLVRPHVECNMQHFIFFRVKNQVEVKITKCLEDDTVSFWSLHLINRTYCTVNWAWIFKFSARKTVFKHPLWYWFLLPSSLLETTGNSLKAILT